MKAIEILLVEDNPGDVLLTKKALEESKLINKMNVVVDGPEALTYLRKEAPYEDATRPDLILLDINLPKISGTEVLAEIKSDENLQTIPVVILTTSASEADVMDSYKSHCNCYIVKPIDFEQFARVIKTIESFWVQIVLLPTSS